MLLRFHVSNYRSILQSVELSLIAVDDDRPATRGFDRLSERVLTVAGIYGPNASGKSNVLDAIAWLSMAVATSLRGWEDDIPRDVHRFGEGPASPSKFDLDLVVGGVRYTYGLEVDDSAVLHESLDSYPERRRRTLFTREGNKIEFRRGFDGSRKIRDLLTPTTLALSVAMRVEDSVAGSVGRMLSGIVGLGLRRGGFPRGTYSDSTVRLLVEEYKTRQLKPFDTPVDRTLAKEAFRALEMLGFADPAISDFDVVEDLWNDKVPRRRLRLVHRVDGQPFVFEFEDESAGTRAWFQLIGPALAALRDGRVLLFDEIDASLHPRLSARLIEIFQDPHTNRHGAQLVFTSHDASLLNTLNRDEVWFAEKEPDGGTRLVALAEFGGERVRKSLNLERAYLQGRFGAVPEVDQVSVRRALGLVFQPRDD